MKVAFCFDLDGTLTNEEILPEIAKQLNLYEEINLLTDITMQGLISFEKSFKLRVKLLSTVKISIVKEVVSKIKYSKLLAEFVRENQEKCFIVTGNLDVWVADFVKSNYGCELFSSIANYNQDELIGIDKIITKSNAINELREGYDTIVAIGDGMNDVSMFEKSDISVAYGGVHEPVGSLIKSANYVVYNDATLVSLLKSLKKHYEG